MKNQINNTRQSQLTAMAIFVLIFGIYGTVSPMQSIKDAIFRGNLNNIKKIVEEQQVDVNSTDDESRTPLMTAVERRINPRKVLDIVKYLISKGANVNAEDNEKFTVLSNAMVSDNVDVIHELLKNGAFASLNDKNYLGSTPFLRAIKLESFKAAKFLADNGASVMIPDNEGKTALDIILGKIAYEKTGLNRPEQIKTYENIIDYLSRKQNEQVLRKETFEKYYHGQSQ